MIIELLLAASTALTGPGPSTNGYKQNKTVVCGDSSYVLKVLYEEFKESVQWTAKIKSTPPSIMALLVNKETKTWTILQFNQEIACVIESGEGYEEFTNIQS